jgi:hypothetical protein
VAKSFYQHNDIDNATDIKYGLRNVSHIPRSGEGKTNERCYNCNESYDFSPGHDISPLSEWQPHQMMGNRAGQRDIKLVIILPGPVKRSREKKAILICYPSSSAEKYEEGNVMYGATALKLSLYSYRPASRLCKKARAWRRRGHVGQELRRDAVR